MMKQTYFKLLILSVFITTGISFSQQPDTTGSHKFLWFHGHWDKQKKNTFHINSTSGGGSKATIQNDCSVKLQTNGIETWNNDIDYGIDDIDKWEDELNKPSIDRQEYAHHLNLALMPFLEDLKKEWKQYKIDPNKKLLTPEQKGLQRFKDSLDNWCRRVKPKYEAIINFYKQHRHDKFDDLKNPSPPEFDYDCAGCDTSIQNYQDSVAEHYVIKFFKPESDLVRNGLAILRELVGLGVSEDIGGGHINIDMPMDMKEAIYYAFNPSLKDLSKAGVCSYINADKLNDAIQFLVRRELERAQKLVRDNKKNFRAENCVTRVFLTAVRGATMFGVADDDYEHYKETAIIINMMKDTFNFYYNKLVKDHDWSQITNIPFILSATRCISMMGGGLEENEEAFKKIVKILNSFQLQIEMDIKVGGQGGYIITHLKGKTKIAPEYNWNTQQCYSWVAALDEPGPLGEPKYQGAGVIHCNLLDNEIVAPGSHPVYIGTKKYYTELKLLKMDFCHPGQDTVLFTSFIPDPAGDGWWKVPESPNQRFGIWQTDAFFKDDNKIIQLAKSGAFQKQAGVMKQKGLKLKAQLEAMENKMKNGGSMPDIHKLQEMVKQVNGIANNKNTSPVFYIDFPLQIHNGSRTIFHKRFDAKQVNPLGAKAVIYGYMTIDISYIGK